MSEIALDPRCQLSRVSVRDDAGPTSVVRVHRCERAGTWRLGIFIADCSEHDGPCDEKLLCDDHLEALRGALAAAGVKTLLRPVLPGSPSPPTAAAPRADAPPIAPAAPTTSERWWFLALAAGLLALLALELLFARCGR